MALLLKFLRGNHNRSAQQRSQRLQREAVRRREDPVIYQVKMKLKNHPDPMHSKMSDDEMTREAIRLTDAEALMEFFSDLTHKPINGIMEEVASDITSGDGSWEMVRQKHLDRVGQLTLKLHLSHLDETPSRLARLGAALLKIPYGVMHASLEIGDTSNPNISYIVEFNDSSLVQPRKKNKLETSALEATIALGGTKTRTEIWPQPATAAEVKLREKKRHMKTGVQVVDDYLRAGYLPIRPRSVCVSEREKSSWKATTTMGNAGYDTSGPESEVLPTTQGEDTTSSVHVAQHQERRHLPLQSRDAVAATPSLHNDDRTHNNLSCTENRHRFRPKSTIISSNITPLQTDPGEFAQMALSKILLVEKLVKIIVQYNRSYYYHNMTRNCQTFIEEVLQSFGVWENFKLGERLDVYLNNLAKGKPEVYKCHKSVNDRVKYLVVSGEIEETTYDEARYLRSLYTVFHLEEFTANARPITAVCSEPDCMLKVLEEHLKKKRPEGATLLQPPQNYI